MQNFSPKPKKSLGQNFLTDTGVLARIVEVADIRPTDTILEIGAGKGVLTCALAAQAKKVIALEIDDSLIPELLHAFPVSSNVSIVHQDILQADIAQLLEKQGVLENNNSKEGKFSRLSEVREKHEERSKPYTRTASSTGVFDKEIRQMRKFSNYKVVANIPYYITAPIIQHLLATQPQPQDIILMVQKEVAERITAQPGDMSILAVSVQAVAHTEYCFTVPKTAFDPVPKVDSAIIRITPFAHTTTLSPFFFRLVKIAFASKRKTLTNTLSSGFHLSKQEVLTALETLGLKPTTRAQELSLDQWHQLTTFMAKYTTNKP
ncbi:MAG: rRNA adenine dimethyltransferase family protein [Candidatus Moraniibacteriota bacterium]